MCGFACVTIIELCLNIQLWPEENVDVPISIECEIDGRHLFACSTRDVIGCDVAWYMSCRFELGHG